MLVEWRLLGWNKKFLEGIFNEKRKIAKFVSKSNLKVSKVLEGGQGSLKESKVA